MVTMVTIPEGLFFTVAPFLKVYLPLLYGSSVTPPQSFLLRRNNDIMALNQINGRTFVFHLPNETSILAYQEPTESENTGP